jgi:hypothetical protein
MTDDDPTPRPARKADGRAAPREGDIIVTAVGEHYAIGRLKADGDSQDYLQSQQERAVALIQACALRVRRIASFCTRARAHPAIF